MKSVKRIDAPAIFLCIASLGILSFSPTSTFCIIVGAYLGFLALLRVLNGFSAYLPRGIARAVAWLHAFNFEFLIMVVVHGILRPIVYNFGNQGVVGRRDGTPVLLIHGYFHDWSAWLYMRRYLAKHGFGPIYSVDLERSTVDPIAKHVETVARMARRIEKETGKHQLILIGHSMGGVIACSFAQKDPTRVKAVVTLGSPLHGTKLAKLAPGRAARDMEPESAHFHRVGHKMMQHPEIAFYQITTRSDELVPYNSALVNNEKSHHYILDDIGHVALLFSPRVAHKIVSWVGKL